MADSSDVIEVVMEQPVLDSLVAIATRNDMTPNVDLPPVTLTQSGAAEASESTLNLEEYMNVVYTCKFCNFGCNSVAEFQTHLFASHLSTDNAEQRPVVETESIAIENEHVVNTNEDLIMEVEDANDGLQSLETKHEMKEETISCQKSSDMSAVRPVNSLSQLNPDHLYTSLASLKAGDIVAESISMAVGNLNTSGDEIENVETVIQDPKTVPADQQSSKDIQLPTPSIEVETSVGKSSDERKAQDIAETDYRELFLCGQCSLGFTGIKECKDHMYSDHNVLLDAVNSGVPTEEVKEPTPSGPEAPSTFKVSVGTQSDAMKRPGRKRKVKPGEDEVQDVTFNGPKRKDIPVVRTEEEVSLLSSQYQKERESQGKRRVRLPRKLQEEYFVAKRRRYTPRTDLLQNDMINLLQLKCEVPGCHAKFRTEESLKYHATCHQYIEMEDHSDNDGPSSDHLANDGAPADPPVPSALACPDCGKAFDKWKQLRLHLWAKHAIDVDLLKCDKCEFRTDLPQKLQVHMEVHTDERPYICQECGKGFRQAAQLKNHSKIHLDNRKKGNDPSKWYHSKQCHICNRTLADSKTLKKHIEIVHEKVKPFTCQYCGHVTSRKHMLIVHMRTHTGEKPHRCDLCTFETSDHNTLRRHRMRHTGERKYKCQHCGYTCIQAMSLKIHLKNKHPGSDSLRYCDTCHYHTVNDASWEQHQQDHMNGLIETRDKYTHRDRIHAGEVVTIPDKGSVSDITHTSGNNVHWIESTGSDANLTEQQVQVHLEVIGQGSEDKTDAGIAPVVDGIIEGGSFVLEQPTDANEVKYVYYTLENAALPKEAAVEGQPITIGDLAMDTIPVTNLDTAQGLGGGRIELQPVKDFYAIAIPGDKSTDGDQIVQTSMASDFGAISKMISLAPQSNALTLVSQSSSTQNFVPATLHSNLSTTETLQIKGGKLLPGRTIPMGGGDSSPSQSGALSSGSQIIAAAAKSADIVTPWTEGTQTHVLHMNTGPVEYILTTIPQAAADTS